MSCYFIGGPEHGTQKDVPGEIGTIRLATGRYIEVFASGSTGITRFFMHDTLTRQDAIRLLVKEQDNVD